MGQFKPMVKMETTEPSIELKLKKGGSVSEAFKNAKKAAKAEHGHKPMAHKADGGIMEMLANTPALVGRPAVNAPVRSPGKPSLAQRRKAMAAGPAKAPMRMPAQAMPPMKKGGKAEGGESTAEHKSEMKQFKNLKSELKTHAGKPASKAHKGLCKGGKAYATGGVVNGQGGFKTGGVAKGQAGYKKGGKMRKYALGGAVDPVTGLPIDPTLAGTPPTATIDPTLAVDPTIITDPTLNPVDVAIDPTMFDPLNPIAYATGATSPVPLPSPTTTPTRRTEMENNQRGGRGNEMRSDRGREMGRNMDMNRSSDLAESFGKMKSAPVNPMKVREIEKSRLAGGPTKKFADGGKVDSGRAEKMPQGRKKPSAPVAINMLSGTFKKGGKVKKFADGGDAMQRANTRGYNATYANETAENEADAKAMDDILMYIPRKIKGALKKATNSLTGQGAVTDTERTISRTVTPPKNLTQGPITREEREMYQRAMQGRKSGGKARK